MRRRVHTLACLLAATACGQTDVVLSPPPGLDAGGAVIFVLEAQGAARLFAADVGSTPWLSIDLPLAGRTRITALTYAASLDALGVPSGEVPLEDATECGARPLPPQEGLHFLEFDARRPGEWTPSPSPRAGITELRIAGPCPCHTFEPAQTTPLGLPLVAYFGDEATDRVLLLDREGLFTWLDADGRLSPIDTATRAPTEGLRSVARDDSDGTLYLGNEDGEVWRGAPRRGFERIAQLQAEGDFFSNLDGGMGLGGFELFGVTELGFVFQLPDRSEALLHLSSRVFASGQRSLVRWLGPGRLVAAQKAALDVVWITEGAEIARAALPSASNGASYLASAPGADLLVISEDSRIFEADGFNLLPRLDAPELSTPSGLVVTDEGYVYAGDTGYLQEFVAGYGFCPTQRLEGSPRPVGMTVVAGRIALFSFVPGGRDLQVILLDRAPMQ